MTTSIGKSGFLLAFWLLAAGAWADPAAQETPAEPAVEGDGQLPSFTASYHVDHRYGNGRTRTTLKALPGENGYVYESLLKAKGFAKLLLGETTEISKFELADDRLVAHRWEFRDGRRIGKKNQWATFDWGTGTAEARYKGETQTLNVEPGTLDRHIVVLALMNDLKNGITRDSYTIVEKRRLRTYTFENLGEEDIATSQGTLKALKLLRRREGSDNIAHIWLAPEFNYLMVRAEYFRKGRRDLVLTLNDVRWLDEEPTSVASKTDSPES